MNHSLLGAKKLHLVAQGRNDGLEGPEDGSQRQGDQHQEEESRENVSEDSGSDPVHDFRVDDESEAGTSLKFNATTAFDGELNFMLQ